MPPVPYSSKSVSILLTADMGQVMDDGWKEVQQQTNSLPTANNLIRENDRFQHYVMVDEGNHMNWDMEEDVAARITPTNILRMNLKALLKNVGATSEPLFRYMYDKEFAAKTSSYVAQLFNVVTNNYDRIPRSYESEEGCWYNTMGKYGLRLLYWSLFDRDQAVRTILL